MNPLSKFKLIKREEIVALIQKGLSIREMALEINVSESVIKSRLSLWKISCKKESKFKLVFSSKFGKDDHKEPILIFKKG